jgi:mRNA interferase RelE/StbE
MSYNIIWSPKSKDDLKNINSEIVQRIIKKVTDLKLAPYHFLEKMTEVNCWKLRIGDYRVLIDINEKEKKINVLKAGHRKKIYKP